MSINLIHNFLKPKSTKIKAHPIGGFQLGPSEAKNGIKKFKILWFEKLRTNVLCILSTTMYEYTI